ncbi:pyruvate kinase [Metallumcola ferriviriculae]|uniref:Pyruvate kinase n=1 Tax=Metallumcola ferriviriculae TaxID=3039180 RepID=A0AAU0URX4_9FIRM|nr:pyruvate kinase [Desulfitibacteraceae bacterium MK1]
MRHTKIVATIGPASDKEAILKDLMKAGLNVARLNFSHGTHEEHGQRVSLIREIAGQLEQSVALMLDTKGPEIRIGKVPNDKMELEEGQEIVLASGNSEGIPVTYKNLARDVSQGDKILLDDGLIGLEVLHTEADTVSCKVLNDGTLKSNKGVNVPGVLLELPAITDKDVEDINFAIEHRLDFIAASFVRRAADVLEIRRILESKKADIHIIAKIETQAAVNNIEAILKVSDGIMVARGDLGVEIPAEEVPLVQKEIIRKCNLVGKPVITATQMLDSMISHPRPTRAEASDVANAILDGTDAIMLSGETAAGEYPVEAVSTMHRIAQRAEQAIKFKQNLQESQVDSTRSVTEAISHASCTISFDLGTAAIITPTESGSTPRMVAKYRPKAPIIAASPHSDVLRKLSLVWGVTGQEVPASDGTDDMINGAVTAALGKNLIQCGDMVVITAGLPVGVSGTTNLLKVHIVGEIIAQGTGIGETVITGTVKIAASEEQAMADVKEGDILVAVGTYGDLVPAMKKAAAVITEEGGLTSHAAIVGLSLQLPVVVGVEQATTLLQNGDTITVDGRQGIIYRGLTKVL